MDEDPRTVPPEWQDLPRISWGGLAIGLGSAWGLFGYSVLWDGAPFAVNPPFVQSIPGTLILLPIRIALWIVHLFEAAAGRSFDFSGNHWWIGVLAGATGAGIALAASKGGRWLLRRRGSHPKRSVGRRR
jgi:hypothetical protein